MWDKLKKIIVLYLVILSNCAVQADICSDDHPEQIVIALEPEAAAIWCRNLRFTMPMDHSNIMNNEKNFKGIQSFIHPSSSIQ